MEGVGVTEAPRGTLFHHHKVDRDGVIQWVNLLIATGQNNLAMQRTIGQIARAYVRDGQFAEGALNRIEAGIRAYDPCLSCSTHALGQMPMLGQISANAYRQPQRGRPNARCAFSTVGSERGTRDLEVVARKAFQMALLQIGDAFTHPTPVQRYPVVCRGRFGEPATFYLPRYTQAINRRYAVNDARHHSR